jgi:acyl-CoA dehydrogenase
MILLARTGPAPAPGTRGSAEGLSLFCVPLDRSSPGLRLRRIPKMGGRAVDANEVFFDRYLAGAETLVGGPEAEGRGFGMVLRGMNAERCLIAGEALGLGYAALGRATAYVRQRAVFGRPVGAFQGVAHPLAEAWMALEAAKLATYRAARMYDDDAAVGGEGGGRLVGVAANSAKYLAAEAAFKACETAVLSMGGMGYAREFAVERYLRECFVPRIAPVSREMIKNFVAEKALGLPRSY